MRLPALLACILLAAPAGAQGPRLNVDVGLGAAGGLLTSSTFEDDITTGTHRAVTVSVPLARIGDAARFNRNTVGVRAGYLEILDDDEDTPRDVRGPAVYLETSLVSDMPVSPWITAEIGYDTYNLNAHGVLLGLVPTVGAGAGVAFNAGTVQAGLLFGGSVTSLFEGASAYLRGSLAIGF